MMLISVVVGIVLAVAYQVLSGLSQWWMSSKKASMMPAFVILSFVARLVSFVVVMVAIGLWSPLSIVGVCLAFAATFTILTGIMLFWMVKRKKAAVATTDKEAS